MPDLGSLESHLAQLSPAAAAVARELLEGQVRIAEAVHQLDERINGMTISLDRTVQAAHHLQNAADAVVQVFGDVTTKQREISAQLADALNKLAAAQADAKSKTGSTDVQAATEDLSGVQEQLDALSDEMDRKAAAVGAAVVANTSADPARAAGGAGGQAQPFDQRAAGTGDLSARAPTEPGAPIPGGASGDTSAMPGGPDAPPGAGTAEVGRDAAQRGDPNEAPGGGHNPAAPTEGQTTAAQSPAPGVDPQPAVAPAAPPVRPPGSI